ncbi:MAG: hypothetical protein IKL53_00955 [Lachnospiraceae bacterium]|nr:hypothetical protein [Lachnospiraceae bacterium]
MAKKKEEVKVSVKDIDYIKIVDEMSDTAFEFCVAYLYPLYNYRVLQETDIRRIDLKENLMRINSMIPSDFKGMGVLNYYLYEMKLYFESLLICKEGCRAEKYKERAMDAIDNALSDDGNIEDVDDAFFCFMTLLHTLRDKFNNDKKYTIINSSFGVEKMDADVIKDLYENKEKTPEGITGKTGLIDKVLSTEYGKGCARKFFFVNNIVFLTRALQNFGVFDMEE